MGRMKSALLAVALACTTIGVTEASVAQAAGGTIHGVVTDSGGTPIAGAQVTVQRREGLQFFLFPVTTDTTGSYTISGLNVGPWMVIAGGAGFAARFGNSDSPDTGTVTQILGTETQQFDVVLPRLTASVSGTVFAADGTPLAGAQVNVSPASGLTTAAPFNLIDFSGYSRFVTTATDGTYRITGLAPTGFTVGFQPPSPSTGAPPIPNPLIGERYLDVHGPGPATVVNVVEGAETGSIDATLDIGATISGRVTDPNGVGVADVFVFDTAGAGFGGASTAADGTYTIIGLSPEQSTIRAFPPQGSPLFASYFGGTTLETATNLTIGLGGAVTGIDIQLQAAGTVGVGVQRSNGTVSSGGMYACISPGVPAAQPPTTSAFGFGPLIGCSSGGTVESLVHGDVVTMPVGTYNAVGFEGAGVFGSTTVTLSAQASFTVTSDTPLDCFFVINGSATCAPADPATRDGDGVLAVVEDGAPNGGDGNSDGIRDATQPGVSSFPAPAGGGYITLVAPLGASIVAAGVSPQGIANQQFETGEISATLTGVPVGGVADITILRTSGGAATEFWSFNHTTRKAEPVPADINGTTITVHIVDGGDFDAPNNVAFGTAADGVVGFSGVPVIPDRVPPTITCPSPTPVFAVGQFPATVTATVTDTGSGVAPPPPTFPPFPPFPPVPPPFPGTPPGPFSEQVPTSVATTGTVTFTASDRAGNTATQMCGYSVVDDGDGVPFFVENGDANADGLPDALQSNVAVARSFSFGGGDTVISTPTGTQLSGIVATSSFVYPTPGLGRTIDSQVVSATVANVVPGAAVSVDLLEPAAVGNGFAELIGSTWTNLPSSVNGNHFVVTLVDGGLGDVDGSANGSISFNGAATTGELIAPVITCGAVPTFRLRQPNALVSATAADASGLATSAFMTQPADTSAMGTFTVSFSATDLVGNTATQTCEYVVTDDGDGVPAAVEDAGPNNGDGNFDGTLDSLQPYVASLPEAVGTGYMTISNLFGTPLGNVRVADFSDLPPAPLGGELHSGVYQFNVEGSLAFIVLRPSGGTPFNSYLRQQGGTWVPASTFVSDGSADDLDGVVNGRISMAIALGSLDLTPPTITCPSSSAFLLNQPNAGITAEVSDSGSGVASSSVTNPVSTSSVGDQAIFVTATDRAGNNGSAICFYSVGVKIDRLIAPNPALTTIVKANRPTPVKWRAVDFFGAPVTDSAHFLGVGFTGSTCSRGPKQDVEPVRDRGLRYLGDGRWEFDVTTPPTKGCYLLTLNLTGATRSVRVQAN